MTLFHSQRLELDEAAARDLDRRMMMLSVIFWLAHFAMMSSRAAAGELSLTLGASLARAATAVVGMALCYGLYLLLKRAPASHGLVRFAWAAAGSAAANIVFTAGNSVAFMVFVPMWRNDLSMTFAPSMLFMNYSYFMLEFIAWSALYATIVGSAELRDREWRLAQAESAAHQAKLSALRLQIQPHFLFNTLNTLSGLIVLDRRAQAEELILNLASLMRRTLAAAPDQLEPLSEEVRAQVMYLAIEQARFPDRLEVRSEVPEDCLGSLVPSMILQPLVENAVKHGLAPSEGAVAITLGAVRREGELELWVSNDAAAPPRAAPGGFGIGLRNVRERLKALFGERAKFEAGPEGSGWTSRMVLPWVTEA
jgi:LytS/YehU family sensor histidine kinase